MSQGFQKAQPILDHLKALVSFDTQNPPRAITAKSDIFEYLQQHLLGFDFQIFDAGDGCLSLLATRGKPELLFNFHIDTVPAAPAWSSDPFELVLSNGSGDFDKSEAKVIGLGACDIKGASACMLSAVAKTSGDIALLFSSDEEHGSSVAVKYFLATDHGFKKVIVSEPTGAKAVLAHRGIQSARAIFSGISGHASEARAFKDSAIHKSGNWMSDVLKWVEQQTDSFDSLTGLPFNIGKIDGGIKANMIAANCELSFGFRPLPGQDAKNILKQLQQLCPQDNNSKNDGEIIGGFFGPTLPSANQDFDQSIAAAKQLAKDNNLPITKAVNFWTEASLFSEAGLTALVFGPGHIAQAHTADEWVSLDQLNQVEQLYCQILQQQNHSSGQTDE